MKKATRNKFYKELRDCVYVLMKTLILPVSLYTGTNAKNIIYSNAVGLNKTIKVNKEVYGGNDLIANIDPERINCEVSADCGK